MDEDDTIKLPYLSQTNKKTSNIKTSHLTVSITDRYSLPATGGPSSPHRNPQSYHHGSAKISAGAPSAHDSVGNLLKPSSVLQ